jgi:alpha 1,2-mannosyltransferase
MNLSKAYDPLEFSRNEGINLWDLFPPNMNCPDLTRIGKVGEGGKWICGLSYLQSLEEDQCVIYSFGINDDISFEIELLLRTNCRIFAFDPTIGKLPIHSHQPNSSLDYVLQNNRRISFTEIRRRIVFQKIALSDFTGTSDQFMWNEALYDIMTRYHHNFINLLKVDIESSEWKIFRSLLYPGQPSAARSLPSLPVGELLIELHHESLEETVDFFQGLYEHHFFSVSREINLIPCLVGGKPFAAEYTFLNVNNFYGVRSTSSQSATSSPLLLSATTAQLRKEIVPVENLQGTAGVIYFLTRQSRVPRMCTALRLLRENFIEQFPRYPVLVFHDDLLSADEDYLRSKCFQLPRVKLLFVRIELKVPKQLTRRKVFIPKKTFCDPLVSSIGYRHMCRFHSHGVHKFIRELQPKLFPDLPRTSSDFFVWRLDDDSLLTAPIGYDIFQFMRMNKKLYGFVSLIKDDPKCVMGLWETSRKYFQRVSAHSFNFSSSLLSQWPDPIVFYNNFEVSHFSLWTHPLWEAFRDYLEQTGGIYTLRWGDAPIHTIGVSALLSRGQIHKFSDVGYSHLPFLQQKPRGLPMPGMDPFLLIPLECYYFKEWKCLVHYENNITANYSFSSAFQRDQFILSASIVQAGGSSSSPASSAVSLPSTVEQKGVLFSFGEERRERLLVRTIQSFFFNFAGPFRVPFVVFYDRRSSFNETVVRQGLTGLPELQLAFHPVQLPNVTHSTGEFVQKNGRCWIRSDPRELAVSLFLQRQVFEVLQLLGFSWFFRFPDDSRLLSPINSNPFASLQRSGKKFGFFSAAVVQSDCFQSLLGLTDDLCGHLLALRKAVGDSSLPDLAVPLLPTCSAGYKDWDKRRVMITSLSISHSSLWDSIFAAMLFDLTHQAGSSPLLSEEFLPSGSTSTAGSSQFHSLLSFFVQVKSSRDWREKIANWGDLFVHNAIVFLSLASEEIHRFDDVFVEFRFNADDSPAIGADTQKPAALAVPDRSANLLRRPLPSLELLLAAQPLGWLGADVAASVPFPNLENGQVKPPDKLLWLFGDTLLGLSSADK